MSVQGKKGGTAASLTRRQEPALPMSSKVAASQTLGDAEAPKRQTTEDIPTGIDIPLPPESKNTPTPPIQHFASSTAVSAISSEAIATEQEIPPQIAPVPKAYAAGTPTPLYLVGGVIAAGLLGYLCFSFYESKQELARMRVEKEALERNAQQEAAARSAAEQQAEAERRARQEAAAREAEAQRRAQKAAGAEAEALRKAEQEAEARRNAQVIEAQQIAKEQAAAERKAKLEVDAQRQYQNALAQVEKSYRYAQDGAKKRYDYGLARASGRSERITSAEKAYHDRLERAQKYYVEKRAQADSRYQGALARITKAYSQGHPNAQPGTGGNVQAIALEGNVSGDVSVQPAVPPGVLSMKGPPGQVADIPAVRVGDTYLVDSQYPRTRKLNNMTERKVISVVDGEVTVASRNVKSNSGQSRVLRFTPEWNLVSSRNADGSGLDYSPPLKYFEFPLYPGKTWRQTSRETNIKTGAIRDFTLSGTVGEWENVSVPAGAFRAIKITIQTEIVDTLSGLRSTGTDVSWYAPDIHRSVKSMVTSRNMQGDVEEQFIHVAQYEVNK